MNMCLAKIALVFISALLLSVSSTRAMTFSESLLGEDVVIVKMQGDIISGDMTRLQNSIAKGNRFNKRKIVISIDSPGGSVKEGAEIATFISENKLPVAVHRECASSCFMIFAASSVKLVSPDAYIGVHSLRRVNGGESMDTMGVSVLMARELRQYGVPANVVGQLVTTNPDEMYRLTNADLSAMGANIAR